LCACSHPGHGFSSACAVVFFVVFNFDITIHTSMELLFCIQIMYIIHENIYNKMYCWEILSEKQLALSFLEYITHTQILSTFMLNKEVYKGRIYCFMIN
jgi:hypothetical protein